VTVNDCMPPGWGSPPGWPIGLRFSLGIPNTGGEAPGKGLRLKIKYPLKE